jgi:sporulation protein YlmC with PRC-barrel domain
VTILLSELYGRRILTADGRFLGKIEEVILNFEDKEVSHLLLQKITDFERSSDVREMIAKNSVLYKRVMNFGDTVIVKGK